MARFKRIYHGRHEGKIVINEGIVGDIVLLTVEELPYVELYRPTQPKSNNNESVKVSFEKEGVFVQVTVKVNYTQRISDIAFKIQEAIRHNVESMTEYRISAVNVIVKGVTFDDVDNNNTEKINNVASSGDTSLEDVKQG